MSTDTEFFQRSPQVVTVTVGRLTFAYHAMFGNPRVLDASSAVLLNFLHQPRTLSDLREGFDGDLESALAALEGAGLVVGPANARAEADARFRESKRRYLATVGSGKTLQRLELAISDACNLNCPHCMHFINNADTLAGRSSMHMSFETARRSIDAFLVVVREQGTRQVRIHFGNGEPLTNFPVLRKVLEYCDTISDISFSFAMNSNLTLLTDEMAAVLKHYRVKIATSLDGTREANNLIRIDRKGRGTYDRIVAKFDMLRAIGHPIEGFTVTVTDRNFELVGTDVVDLAIAYDIHDVAVDFDLVATSRATPEQCVAKVIEMRRYARSRGVSLHGTWETPYRNIMTASWSKGPHAFCPAMEGQTLEFGVDGDIRTCGHTNTVVGHGFDVGATLAGNEFLRLIDSRLPGNNSECVGCVIEGPCAGQCQVTRESLRRDPRLFEFTCELLRAATRALIEDYLVAAGTSAGP